MFDPFSILSTNPTTSFPFCSSSTTKRRLPPVASVDSSLLTQLLPTTIKDSGDEASRRRPVGNVVITPAPMDCKRRRVTQVPGVIIVGAGVAGAALACTLEKQVKSLISGKNVHNGYFVGPNQMASKTYVSRFKESNEEQRVDRFIRLQNVIKQCDGSDHRENIQLLLHLSPLERCKHAIELEKRAI
ncbi:hypothetical protein L1987_00817 [Smallanthus sonchifolius]|uniref:Uncharacterized protein n=1 Tax=Smallanthus sonchifolius TaxID=185202 RepID=A0ACB9K3C8_9ASTR|nr:hypothetical protein L1987_00817 [Smallanthus sonchifolius]